MKRFIALIMLALSTVAFADSTQIFETENYSNYDVYPEFEVNKSLGRAWVNVVLSQYVGDSSDFYDNRVKIEGLTYDSAEKTIVLEKNGERIVCASLYHRRFVIDGGNSVRMSGRCKFSIKKLKVSHDDGFEVHRIPVIQVYLDVE